MLSEVLQAQARVREIDSADQQMMYLENESLLSSFLQLLSKNDVVGFKCPGQGAAEGAFRERDIL